MSIGRGSARRAARAGLASTVALRWVAIAFAAGAAACGRASPPIESFDVTLELPPKGKPAPAPPEGALRTWRVWINQERPRQKKAPEWRSYGAKEGASLDMATDGKWRCVVNAVHVFGKVNEHAKLANWIVSRSVRCSSDGWKTFVEGHVQADFDNDGKETQTTPSAPIYLNDVVGGQPRSTVVVLEGDKVVRRPMVD